MSETRCKSLNTDQYKAFCMIMKAVEDKSHPQQIFVLNAPGGYGKTFPIETMLFTVRGQGKIALAVASS